MISAPLFPIFPSYRLAAVTALVVFGGGCQRSQTVERPTTNPTESVGTVTIEIIFDSTDPTTNIKRTVPIDDGATLESVMRGLRTDTEDPLEMTISGADETAFVQSIGAVTTDASRGWTYTIDGEFATKGIGSVRLQPGRTVRWQFTTFKEAMKTQQ